MMYIDDERQAQLEIMADAACTRRRRAPQLEPTHHLLMNASTSSKPETDALYEERLDAFIQKQLADVSTFAAREGRSADEVAPIS